jgi:hypothetical protein
MFENQTPQNLPVEDILEKTEGPAPKPPVAGIVPPMPLRPAVPPLPQMPKSPVSSLVGTPPSPVSTGSPLPPGEPVKMETPKQGWKKVLIIAGAVVFLGVIGFSIKLFVLEKTAPVVEKPASEPEAPEANVPEVAAPPTAAPEAPEAVDSDNDGIADDEEISLGTDPRNADTDDDGLFDGEEVKVYKTNPLDKDTDKDGYFDGEEVKNGYNPLGPGKIFAAPPL